MKQLRRHGFTLMEVLIATALVGLVLALAMKGFLEMKYVSDLTQAKMIARDQAAQGVRKIADVLERAHIIYYNGAPLTGDSAPGTRPPSVDIPALFATAGGSAGILRPYPANDTNLTASLSNMTLFPPRALGTFRFWDAAQGGAGGFIGMRLQTAGPAATNFDRFFPMPLLYCAEATFSSVAPTIAAPAMAAFNVPVEWTFHVIYLAPMDLRGDPNHPLSPVRGASTLAQRDRGGRGVASWARSTIPFELRLLTIRGIGAAKNAAANDPGTGGLNLTVGGRSRPYGRRTYGDRNTPPTGDDRRVLLGFPFDWAQNAANYDPYPVGAAADLTSTNDVITPNTSCGHRINSAVTDPIHHNFRNIGNDPPTRQALAVTTPRYAISEKVLARYVDPDNVHGTCLRLMTTNPRPTGNRYFNAYNNSPVVAPASSWDFAYNPRVTPPRRALVSVSTRYRSNKRMPFQFQTQSVEVDLEALYRYQDVDRRLVN